MTTYTAHTGTGKTITIEKDDGTSAVWEHEKGGRYTSIRRWKSSAAYDAYILGKSKGYSGKTWVFDGRKLLYKGPTANEPELYED